MASDLQSYSLVWCLLGIPRSRRMLLGNSSLLYPGAILIPHPETFAFLALGEAGGYRQSEREQPSWKKCLPCCRARHRKDQDLASETQHTG